MKKVFYLLCLFFFTASCNEDDVVLDPRGSIYVTVFNNGWDRVENAQVSTEPISEIGLTDITGAVILSDLPIGGYKVNAFHPSIGSGSASVTVIENAAVDVSINLLGGVFENPTATIQFPLDQSSFNIGSDIQFSALVGDESDNPNSLEIEWSSSLDGILNTGSADGSGLTTFTVNNLSSGEHEITVLVTDSDDFQTFDKINITIKDLPESVTLSPLDITGSGLELSWTSSTEPTFANYKILRSENSTGPFEVIEVISDVNTTSYIDSGLGFGQFYYYQIVVVVSDGEESVSNIESALFEGENINLGVNIVRMILDPSRPYIYALDQINNSLLFINKNSKSVEKTIFVGSSPSDIDINLDNSKAYVANYGSSQIAVIDLETQEKIDDIFVDTQAGTWDGNPYRLSCLAGDKLCYTSEDQWNNLKVVDANTGAFISVTASVYQPGLLTNSAQNQLFVTESGSSGSEAIRFNFDGTTLDQVSSSSSQINYSGIRDACISDDDLVLFYNGNKLLTNNLQSNLGTFSEKIIDCNSDGSIGIGEENIWNAETFSIIKPLPVSSDIIRLDHDDNTIYIYDTNSSKIYITTVQ